MPQGIFFSSIAIIISNDCEMLEETVKKKM